MKDAALIFTILAIVFIWTGLTGRLGAVLGAVFEPSRMVVNG